MDGAVGGIRHLADRSCGACRFDANGRRKLDAANNALTALNAAITGAADLTDAEKATYVREADNAAAPINTAQMAFDAAEDEDQKAADAAAMADARKLFVGIGPRSLDRYRRRSAERRV